MTNERLERVVLVFVLVLALIVGTLFGAAVLDAFAAPEVCPSNGGWTKVDSDDLSSYPVDGATDYCFKAGSSNSQGCEGGLFDTWPVEGACGLSHWAYFIPDDTSTPEVTNTFTPEPTDTQETPTITPDPDETPTETPVVTNTPTAVTNTPNPTATPRLTNTPSPQAPPTCIPENNPTGGRCTGGKG